MQILNLRYKYDLHYPNNSQFNRQHTSLNCFLSPEFLLSFRYASTLCCSSSSSLLRLRSFTAFFSRTFSSFSSSS